MVRRGVVQGNPGEGYDGSRAGGYHGPGWVRTGLMGHCRRKRLGMVGGSFRRLEGRCFRVECLGFSGRRGRRFRGGSGCASSRRWCCRLRVREKLGSGSWDDASHCLSGSFPHARAGRRAWASITPSAWWKRKRRVPETQAGNEWPGPRSPVQIQPSSAPVRCGNRESSFAVAVARHRGEDTSSDGEVSQAVPRALIGRPFVDGTHNMTCGCRSRASAS